MNALIFFSSFDTDRWQLIEKGFCAVLEDKPRFILMFPYKCYRKYNEPGSRRLSNHALVKRHINVLRQKYWIASSYVRRRSFDTRTQTCQCPAGYPPAIYTLYSLAGIGHATPNTTASLNRNITTTKLVVTGENYARKLVNWASHWSEESDDGIVCDVTSLEMCFKILRSTVVMSWCGWTPAIKCSVSIL